MEISQLNGNPFADAAFRKYIETEGAVIFSFNDEFSPADLWGGSWEKIIDRVLVGAGGDYTLESSGGNLLHNHGEALSIAIDQAAVKVKTYGQDNVSINGAYQLVTDEASVMPPYISCNIWRKVA